MNTRNYTDDEGNLSLCDTSESMDARNAAFYARFPYPWPPQTFSFPSDPEMGCCLLNQNIGNYRHDRFFPGARIWVAGCGTNQAIYTALRYPGCHVVGSDVSEASLEICAETSRQLGISNLLLKKESINEIEYIAEFDYILCTGVVHHNADPKESLEKLHRALRRSGVLELMVYNRFHRQANVAVQKAIRLLCQRSAVGWSCEEELRIARTLLAAFKEESSVQRYLLTLQNVTEAELVDCLIQPIEHGFTMETLTQLAASAGLELLTPAICELDKANKSYDWTVTFSTQALQKASDKLDDISRWMVANLLLAERSPMLWCYLQRGDSEKPRQTESDVNACFLRTKFKKIACTQGYFRKGTDGRYALAKSAIPFPTGQPPDEARRCYSVHSEQLTMKEVFDLASVRCDFSTVQRVRRALTTTAFPFLRALSDGER